MKLKNKRTGEIGELQVTEKHCAVAVGNGTASCGIEIYSSLAQLFKEWEDAPEEPKEFWFVDADGEVRETNYLSGNDKVSLRNFGNYFGTEEEAKQAVEKLKAFKRLKDKGFRFEPVDSYEALCGNGFNIPITATMPPEAYTDAEVSKDLDVCFGGEE